MPRRPGRPSQKAIQEAFATSTATAPEPIKPKLATPAYQMKTKRTGTTSGIGKNSLSSRMAVFEKKKKKEEDKNASTSGRDTNTSSTRKWRQPATTYNTKAPSSKNAVASFGGSFNGFQSDPTRGLIKKKTPSTSAQRKGFRHNKSASVASISQKFGGIRSPTFKRGVSIAKAKGTTQTQTTSHTSSVMDRAAMFGGTRTKKSSSQKPKSSTARVSPPSASSVFGRSMFAKPKAKPADAGNHNNNNNNNSLRQGSATGRTSGLRQGSGGARLRGSSVTSKRGTPAIVRNSIERSKATAVKEVQVTARFSFDAEADDELSFRSGDVISIIHEASEDWWEGSLGGKSGIFPKNYATDII
jgi:hypothetical protein